MSYIPLIPELLLIALSILVLLLGLFLKEKKSLGYLSLAGLVVALLLVISNFNMEETFPGFPFYNSIVVDPFSQFFNILFVIIALLVCLASLEYYGENPEQAEYYFLLLLATAGMMVVAIAQDLVTLFVGFELASLSTYALTAFDKKDPRSLEAAMKYFLIGALSSAIMLFGMSFIYGTTGSTNFVVISKALANSPLSLLGAMLLVAGFGFKMALVPFHMWAPDTYQGAPSVVSAFLASASKKMGFIAAFRVLVFALIVLRLELYLALSILAVITMTLGNVVAIMQRSVKRMLAYSSIAHAGYIAIAFVVAFFSTEAAKGAIAGGILQALSHAIATTGAFITTATVASFASSNDGEDPDSLESFSGLAKRAPITALSLAILLLSLAGIPPTFGFYSKFVLFLEAIRGDLLWLAIIGVLNSALSVYYYARVIRHMYWGEPKGEKIDEPLGYMLPVVLAAALVLILFLYSGPVYSWALKAAGALLF